MPGGPHILELVEQARTSPDLAARQLAAVLEQALAEPGRSVKAAFGLSRRGGEPADRRERRRRRDDALRELARLLGPDLLPEQRARETLRRADRYALTAWPRERTGAVPDSPDRRLLREVMATGLGVPRLRRLKGILAAGPR